MGCNGGLEGALFSALVAIQKEREDRDEEIER